MKYLIYILTTIFSYSVLAQDSIKIYSLIEQSKEALNKNNLNNALQYAHQSLSLSSLKQNYRGITSANNQLAFIFESQSNYDSANYF